MSCQFVVNFVDEAIKHNDESDDYIALKAFEKIDFKNAILGGMISYSSLDNSSKVAFNCARAYFTRLENGGESISIDLTKGTFDCFIELAMHVAFSKIKGTEKMKSVVDAFSDAAKRDILLKRLKKITSDDCFNTVESIIKKSIQKQY